MELPRYKRTGIQACLLLKPRFPGPGPNAALISSICNKSVNLEPKFFYEKVFLPPFTATLSATCPGE